MVIYCNEYEPTKQLDFYVSKSKKKANYLQDIIALDTETSHNHNDEMPVGWIYQWAFKFCDDVVIGRTPTELLTVLDKIISFYGLNEKNKILIYVHNLSYDMNYLVDFLVGHYGNNYTQISPEVHKFTTFSIGGLEFRCSYMLSNSSLDKWCNDLNTEHKKLTGAIDYNVIRYQDTELQQIDWDYMIGDVESLYDCVQAQLSMYKDTLSTVPLTSTGYIRREERNNYKKDRHNYFAFIDTMLDVETYLLCETAFSGAYTHGNRFFAGKTVNGKIRHRDFRSHYPSQIMCYQFPIGRFNLLKENATIQYCLKMSNVYCQLIVITLKNCTLKKGVTMPYLQQSKCYAGRKDGFHSINDNGRILKFTGETTIVITELDLKLICKQYNIEEYYISKVYGAIKGDIPEFIAETTNSAFYGKTAYKYEEKNAKTVEEKAIAHLNLMQSKALLNAIYGCKATRPVRQEFKIENGEWTREELTNEVIKEKLDAYYKSYNSFNRFQFGVWITSCARYELFEYIECIGYENCLYSDTDSAFYISTPEIEARIEKLNEHKKQRAINKGAFIEYNEKIINYDSFDLEDEEITSFRFLHSKCYGYTLESGKMELVIAGVTKYYREDLEKSIEERRTREDELGSLENLQSGFVFEHCGGTSCTYHPHIPTVQNIEGHRTEFSSSAIIKNVCKTMSLEFQRDDSILYTTQ